MAIERLPQRVRTPAVARAVTSPSAVLAAGAGTSVAVLAGLPLAAAGVVGALAWAARVAMAVPRPARPERVDPMAVGEPWRRFVTDALDAQARFAVTVGQARPGPLRDRLVELGSRLDHGVRECWRIARQGDGLESALRHLDRDAVARELADLRRERDEAPGGEVAALGRAERALAAQLASARRVEAVARDTRTRLRVLNAQLDEAVARAVELSVSAGDIAELRPLWDEVESLVGELESLRQGLEETAAPGGGGAPASGSP